jgi:signal transduction histidine kinase
MTGHTARTLGMGVIYFLACYIALSIDVTNGAASIWPASGLLLGVLLLCPDRSVPSVLVGTLIGGVAANLSVGFEATTSIGYTCINIGEGLAARWLVRRYCPDAPRLTHPTNGFALIACGVGAACTGALVAGTVAHFTSDADWVRVAATWAGSDGAGVVIVTPVILATAAVAGEIPRPLPRWRVIEAALLLAVIVAASNELYLSAHPSLMDQVANTLVTLPLVAWAAIRFETAGAAWAIFVVNAFCIWGTAIGRGPLFDVAPQSVVNMIMQARVSVTGIVALSLGAAVGAARRLATIHRRLALELQSAVDVERTRLSHELHDDVAQKLAALKMQLQLDALCPDAGRPPSPASSVAIVDDLLVNVRSLSHSLRPAPFDRGQLLPALTALARSESNRSGLRVVVDSKAAVESPVPHEVELACYRVVREALTNVVKHAGASHVAVSLSCHTDRLTLSVADDGCGFEVGPATRQAVRDGHLGLVGMRERVDHVGGTLTVDSTPGEGTTITCLVPLGVAA